MDFTSIFAGGLTGLIGNIVTSVANYKTQQLKNEHEVMKGELELKKISAEKEMMIAEAEANIKITQTQIEGEVEIADSKAYDTSQKVGNQKDFSDAYMEKLWSGGTFAKLAAIVLSTLFGLMDFIKSFMRPGLTAYLVALSSWLTYEAVKVMNAQHGDTFLTAGEAKELFENITMIILYLMVACVTWWFGDRRIAKFLMRLNDGNGKTVEKVTLNVSNEEKKDK